MSRTVEEIKAIYADMPPRTRAWLQSIGSTSLSDCLALLDHIAELEATNAALQAQLAQYADLTESALGSGKTTLEDLQDLVAQNTALQAQVGVLGEWQDKTTVKDSMNEDSGYWVKSIGDLELLAIIPGSAGISHLGTLEWGFAEPPYKVVGWRYRPDESPTAAVSESEERMTKEEHEYKVADEINALLDDLEQDVIAEMHAYDGSQPAKKQIGWNQALQQVLHRLQAYRRE